MAHICEPKLTTMREVESEDGSPATLGLVSIQAYTLGKSSRGRDNLRAILRVYSGGVYHRSENTVKKFPLADLVVYRARGNLNGFGYR